MVISRMAPTPNGDIHWGNLRNFAETWARVRLTHGKLWLRFDDMDQDRCEERFAEDTREILRYLGLHWDDELSGQRDRMEVYRRYLGSIPHYACECSRKEIHERTGDYHYDGHCRDRGLNYRPGESSIRFLSPRGPNHDFVLWRREDLPAYHLTSVCDDELLGVNLIVRGRDLLESTAIQRELSACLPSNPLGAVSFIHHDLLVGKEGEKLAKSRGDGVLTKLMREGVNPREIWKELGHRAGWGTITGEMDLLKMSFFQRS